MNGIEPIATTVIAELLENLVKVRIPRNNPPHTVVALEDGSTVNVPITPTQAIYTEEQWDCYGNEAVKYIPYV